MIERRSVLRARSISLHAMAVTLLAAGLTRADDKPGFVLTLTDGGHLAGELRASKDAKVLRWQSPAFAKPLEFPQSVLKSVRVDTPGKPQAPVGEFCFELASSDFVYGDLLEVTDSDMAVSSAMLGKLRLSRDQLRRIYRYKGADSIYLGPNGLAGWKEKARGRQWMDDGGQLQTSQSGASLFSDLGIPEKARIEVELSWNSKPDFVLGLGVDEKESAPRGVHFEVWDQDLVAVAESAREADVAPLQRIVPGPGRIRIQAYLDQAHGRLVLLSPTGKVLATLNTHAKAPRVQSGVRLTNGRGDLRLESIRIGRWNGDLPREAKGDQPRLHRTDGSIVYGRLTRYDAKKKQFILRDGSTDTVVNQDAVGDLLLMPADDREAAPGSDEKKKNAPKDLPPSTKSDATTLTALMMNGPNSQLIEDDAMARELLQQIKQTNQRLEKLKTVAVNHEDMPEFKKQKNALDQLNRKLESRLVAILTLATRDTAEPDQATPPVRLKADGVVRVSLRDGQRLSGALTRIEDHRLVIACPGFKDSLTVPVAELQGLTVPRPAEPPTSKSASRSGRLEMDGVSLSGWLEAGVESSSASCLVWRPSVGLNASPIALGRAGRIVYVDLSQHAAAAQPAARSQQVFVQQNGAVMVQRIEIMQEMGGYPRGHGPSLTLLPGGGKPALHLRTGDTIPCEVTGIDEKGVSLKTPTADTTFVPHDKIKSVELISTWGSNQIEEAKRERLLTLPRLQRDSPPTHLICSKNGDFLRGRIVSMDEDQLKVEVRLETRTIPRDRVAQIIWLHQDELGDKPVTQPAAKANLKTRVQAIRPSGDRLTFVATQVDLEQISGRSEILGPCHARLGEIDQILFGSTIEESVAMLAYQRWKLHHALDPKFVQADGAPVPGGVSGLESPLVGQPAFAFQLEMLDGKQFDLAARKGRILVLDFWATWCGPCMQSMPLVDEVVRSFADKQVDLVAINLEEQPQAIKSMLERHKLKVPVALDRDGVIAAKYAVTAIPQTVVIDREGKVVRLFVGGGKNTADALRKVLQELIEGKAPEAPK